MTSPDHEQSYQMLVDGKADAFATDDILLYGLIARHKAQDKFKVIGEYLSYDPYGIMFRKGEPQLTAVVERTFRKLGSNRDLIPLYNKWFVARLPTGEKLGVSISPQLEEAFKVLDDTQGRVTSAASLRASDHPSRRRGCGMRRFAPGMTEARLRKTSNPARGRRWRPWRIRSPEIIRRPHRFFASVLAASSCATRTASSIVAAT